MLVRCLGCMQMMESNTTVCPHCGYAVGTPAEEAVHLVPGTKLQKRYLVGRVLGYGGFGVTYIGWDERLEQRIAIKEYLPSEFSTRVPGRSQVTVFEGEKKEQFRDGLKKFVEEARHLAQFQNEPGIVRVYDSFEENDTAYIIMEYLEGRTLSAYLEKEGTVSGEKAVEMLTPLMESLQVVHEKGILHRDIAPDNIFITNDGEVKLIDFGASRYATTSHSRSLTVIIKPGYSPEEQYRSRGDQGPHTDVYALAATMYKMITGVTPPDALERRAQYENKNKDILVEPHKIKKGIPLGIENAILNGMNVRIEDRTPDVMTFMKELNANPPVKRIYGKIKKIDLYRLPLWLKIAVPTALVLVIAFVGLLLSGVIRFSGISQKDFSVPDGVIMVPDVEGMLSAEAIKKVEDSGLVAKSGGNVTTSYQTAGTIVLQSPNSGSFLNRNETVYLTVSSGSEVAPPFNGIATVPYLIWNTLEEVNEKISQAGLGEPIIEEAYDENVAEGQVISQSIENGTEVEEGAVLTLVVSKGSEPFLMPDYKQKNFYEIKEDLIALGLRIEITYAMDETNPYNTIIYQNPIAGGKVRRGDTVKLRLAEGNRVTFETVIGKTQEEAEKILNDLGFSVNVIEVYDGDDTKGLVLNQSPPNGSLQEYGSTGTLFVSKGSQDLQIWYGGNSITFGNYGGEDIEWQILDADKDQVLVISRFALDAQPYHSSYADISWEKCSLRSWLNNDFYNAAFSEEEKERIQTTSLTNPDNSTYGTPGGNSTEDKIFLLSKQERAYYDELFNAQVIEPCRPTEYAKGNGVRTDEYGFCYWWLRSPGRSRVTAIAEACWHNSEYDYFYEHINDDGSGIFDEIGVRPVLWYDAGDLTENQTDEKENRSIPSKALCCIENGWKHYYYVYEVSSATSWETAEEYCRSKGGHLATLTSDLQNQTAYYAFDRNRVNGGVYFGLVRAGQEEDWKWVTGESFDSFDYYNWDLEETNNGTDKNYGSFKTWSQTWVAAAFNEKNSKWILCEWDIQL